MREIKFRAWDKSSKAMCKVKRILNFDGKMHFILDNPNSDFWGNNYGCDIDRIELMQFTGLKDNKRTKEYPNGQEIYEGDIVKLTDYHGERIVIIDFGNGTFYYKGDGFSDEYLFNALNKTIIGNIYENPELLEDYK